MVTFHPHKLWCFLGNWRVLTSAMCRNWVNLVMWTTSSVALSLDNIKLGLDIWCTKMWGRLVRLVSILQARRPLNQSTRQSLTTGVRKLGRGLTDNSVPGRGVEGAIDSREGGYGARLALWMSAPPPESYPPIHLQWGAPWPTWEYQRG